MQKYSWRIIVKCNELASAKWQPWRHFVKKRSIKEGEVVPGRWLGDLLEKKKTPDREPRKNVFDMSPTDANYDQDLKTKKEVQVRTKFYSLKK